MRSTHQQRPGGDLGSSAAGFPSSEVPAPDKGAKAPGTQPEHLEPVDHRAHRPWINRPGADGRTALQHVDQPPATDRLPNESDSSVF